MYFRLAAIREEQSLFREEERWEISVHTLQWDAVYFCWLHQTSLSPRKRQIEGQKGEVFQDLGGRYVIYNINS